MYCKAVNQLSKATLGRNIPLAHHLHIHLPNQSTKGFLSHDLGQASLSDHMTSLGPAIQMT